MLPAYSVLYSFKGGFEDGANPTAGLINLNGTLYGTTLDGGGDECHHVGCGTAFAITKSGRESVLYDFKGNFKGKKGLHPFSALLDVNGALYSTTAGGGANNDGTVFAITTSGKETVLHSFEGPPDDGEFPVAGLINVNGTLYGTTEWGGSCGCGTVFSITTSGGETVLHSFAGGSEDGDHPYAGLIHVNGTLYGTTRFGGSGSCSYSGISGCGTVFSITTSGTETVLYSFKGGETDGETPEAGLIDINGTLYGTTVGGGAHSDGTVFSITTSGAETVLHSFPGHKRDGKYPDAGLVNAKGILYGTTGEGGANRSGTVFKITTSGKETVLYSFNGGKTDGASPQASLIVVNGKLYGTTEYGGASDDGTVFSLAP